MNKLHPLRPLDLARALPWLWSRDANGSRSPRTLGPSKPLFLPSLSFAFPFSSRKTWVWEEGGALAGLLSAFSRNSRRVWEVDFLFLAPRSAEGGAAFFEGLSLAWGKQGIEKVFLRLPENSPILKPAQESGFTEYGQEIVLQGWGGGNAFPHFTPRGPGDECALFRLHNSVAPIPHRRAEGLTLQEWQEAWEGKLWEAERLYWEKGELLAWLRWNRRGCFNLLYHPNAEGVLVGLVDGARAFFKKGSPIFCLAPLYLTALHSTLLYKGFREKERLSLLVKPVTLPVKTPFFIPARA